MKTDCLKVYVKRKKVFLLVYGISHADLMKNYGLIYEILKTIGKKMSVPELMEPEDIGGVSIEKEFADYVVEVKNGNIKILDFI